MKNVLLLFEIEKREKKFINIKITTPGNVTFHKNKVINVKSFFFHVILVEIIL